MKKRVTKSKFQKELDDIVTEFHGVVGRDARKWANKLIKEHNVTIPDFDPRIYTKAEAALRAANNTDKASNDPTI